MCCFSGHLSSFVQNVHWQSQACQFSYPCLYVAMLIDRMDFRVMHDHVRTGCNWQKSAYFWVHIVVSVQRHSHIWWLQQGFLWQEAWSGLHQVQSLPKAGVRQQNLQIWKLSCNLCKSPLWTIATKTLLHTMYLVGLGVQTKLPSWLRITLLKHKLLWEAKAQW